MSVENPNQALHSFYAVLNEDGRYFAGYNTTAMCPDFVDDVHTAKLFTNKYEVKLRPTEKLVEVQVELTPTNTNVSEPFRPRFRPREQKR